MVSSNFLGSFDQMHQCIVLSKKWKRKLVVIVFKKRKLEDRGIKERARKCFRDS